MAWPKHADLVLPNGNEKDLLMGLKALGFRTAILCYEEGKKIPDSVKEIGAALKIDVKTAFLLKDRKRIGQLKRQADFLIGTCSREFFEDKRVDAILGPGLEQRKDHTHYRRSLTQVEAELSKNQDKPLLFNFADLLAAKRQDELLGRWMQDLMIFRKKRAPFQLVSGAKDSWGLRSRKDLEFFMQSF